MIKALLAFLLLSFSPAFAIQVKVAEAPTNDLALLLQAIQSARSNLLVNIYDMSSTDIAQALLERIRDGVRVEILEEGQPVGGLSPEGRAIRQRLARAMSQAGKGGRFFVMTSKPPSDSAKPKKRRYRFDHAKYIVVDDETLVIGSENYSSTGHPREGTKGNRGWEVWIRDGKLADYFERVFRKDSDTSIGDVFELTDRSSLRSFSGDELAFLTGSALGLLLDRKIPVLDADAVAPILSPDNSLKGLVKMLDRAEGSIDIEQMTFDSAWGKDGKSPLLAAVIRAARRGVKVRVLLNDEWVFNHGDTSNEKNAPTVRLLNSIAKKEKLRLEGRIANLKKMGVTYIHNKGALIDGEYTLISSINWNQNSVENNREAAALIRGSEINAHYQALFDADWKASGRTTK